MGNICGKEDPDASPPGRVLGSAPPAQKTSSIPKKVGGPPRTLGGSTSAPPSGEDSPGRGGGQVDARRRAAEAAEARAKAANKGGKLHSQLSAQKRQSRSDTLKQASEQEQRARDADNAARTRNWD
ncbi:hypothetical protein TOPH_05872 [Tolypocladium ophioglossoides CBS 100239]|uniref:Uncharacterized protein n=1 Tax=Tolypocladium ophioglossoides (strain CBS 100239) TaxID=1163406 RepID=A0A0L0N611_TOLOC|nr:hypothetical protein TOPH_05872 [Tolypocladium ophioglossoides CBS 100239]